MTLLCEGQSEGQDLNFHFLLAPCVWFATDALLMTLIWKSVHTDRALAEPFFGHFCLRRRYFAFYSSRDRKKKLLTWIQNDMKTLGKENVVPTAVDVLISAFKDLYICRREVGTCTAKMDTLTCTQRPMNDNAPGLWCFTTHSFLWPRPIDRPGYCGQKTEAL